MLHTLTSDPLVCALKVKSPSRTNIIFAALVIGELPTGAGCHGLLKKLSKATPVACRPSTRRDWSGRMETMARGTIFHVHSEAVCISTGETPSVEWLGSMATGRLLERSLNLDVSI